MTMKWRTVIVSGTSLAVLPVLVVLASVWIEDRFPSDQPDRAILPSAQRVLTKPVVDVLGRQVGGVVRRRLETRWMNTGHDLGGAIADFLDESKDWTQRRRLAYRLAREATPSALAALEKVMMEAPPEHRAFMAQLIGSTGNPKVFPMLWALVDGTDERVALAAIRGLSARGNDAVAGRLAEILQDSKRSLALRIEAACGLGNIGGDVSLAALSNAFARVPEDALAEQVLNSLGRFPFARTGAMFKEFVSAVGVSPELRTLAVESLAHTSDDVVPWLVELAGSDRDPNVRAGAAWAISAHETVTNLGTTLAGMLESEQDADVRRRLYEAMLPQADIPAEKLAAVVMAESDPSARVAGFNALGRTAFQQPASSARLMFDELVVPELVRIATTPNSLNLQMRAVFALRRAQTETAQEALAMIASRAQPQVASAARNGLRAPNG